MGQSRIVLYLAPPFRPVLSLFTPGPTHGWGACLGCVEWYPQMINGAVRHRHRMG